MWCDPADHTHCHDCGPAGGFDSQLWPKAIPAGIQFAYEYSESMCTALPNMPHVYYMYITHVIHV